MMAALQFTNAAAANAINKSPALNTASGSARGQFLRRGLIKKSGICVVDQIISLPAAKQVLYLGLVEVDYHLISNIRFQRKGEIDELIRI